MKRLLIVEDEGILRQNLASVFTEHGYSTQTASSGTDALKILDDEQFDLVITDIRMPGADGLAVLRKAREAGDNTPVLVMTAYGTVDSAVDAMRLGAYDYIQKPFDLEELEMKVVRALDHQREARQLEALRETEPGSIISRSPAMAKVFQIVDRVARSRATVLITGETGTGKERVGEAIHLQSWRREHNLVKVNCAAIPEELIESELFGYERGAFTGAVRRRLGRFSLADEGTLFLDEVGSMALHMQAKLLRVLQDKEFERVGGEKTIRVDVRVIAATNRDLHQSIKEGYFREDLFHRLSVVNIHIPSLRERQEDILPLANSFLDRYRRELHREIKGLSEAAQEKLLTHPWPGNVRELKNAIERAVLMNEGEFIHPAALSLLEPTTHGGDGGARSLALEPDSASLEEIERKAVLDALDRAKWVQKDAASILGISSRVMNYKIRKFNLRSSRWTRNRPLPPDA